MQILQRVFKGANEPPKDCNYKKQDRKTKSNEIALFNGGATRAKRKRDKKARLSCSNLNPFDVLCRRDVSKSCLTSTFDLKRLGSCDYDNKNQLIVYQMKMKKEDSSGHVGNKVLPITDATLSSSKDVNIVEKKVKGKGEKIKAMSKMKELLRWAAATKGDNKGGKYITRKMLQFKNRGALKSVSRDDEFSNDSPKISFRWEMESCSSATSSVYSALSVASSTRKDSNVENVSSKSSPTQIKDQCFAPKTGNWITTDSEFVVLEL